MRPVHQRLLDIALAALGEAAPIPATPEQIAAAEARLGRPLPPGYRAFLAEVGHTSWSTLLALPPNKSLLTDARVRYAPRARQKPGLCGQARCRGEPHGGLPSRSWCQQRLPRRPCPMFPSRNQDDQ